MIRRFCGATAAAVFLCLLSGGGSAQVQSAAASSAAAADPEYQALFKRMYADPQNMDVTFKFAEVAARLGDYEAAIGALERVLYYNPNLAGVKVELARLYLRIGGKQVAQSYVQQAIATPGATPEAIAAASQLLIAGDAGVPSAFSFFLYGGMRYQTNASAGSSSTLIRSSGDVVPIDSAFARTPDWNSFLIASAGYSHDLGGGAAAELSLFGYYAKQVKLSRFDLGLVEVQAGPRFAVPLPMVSASSVKLYAIGTASWLAENPYFSSAGVGISSRFTVTEGLRLEPSYEYRDRDFKNSELYTTSSQQTGKLQVVALNGDGKLFGLGWVGRVAASWNETDNAAFDFNSYDRLSGDIAFPIPFSLDLWETAQRFVFTPTVGFSLTDYARPNPAIDPAVTRADREWRVGASLDMQINQSLGVRTSAQYTKTDSNLPNFETNNLSISIGPTYPF